jgi:hypothetical protein
MLQRLAAHNTWIHLTIQVYRSNFVFFKLLGNLLGSYKVVNSYTQVYRNISIIDIDGDRSIL